jgi:cyclopropane fatty-acyl-phospholipid synthase-like methyltransferase
VSDRLYSSYSLYKNYNSPTLSAKSIARFDEEVWIPARFNDSMKCLEIGSGTGIFLLYLSSKGIEDLKGIDHDENLQNVQPDQVKDKFENVDVWKYLSTESEETFDRIILFDVLEHFVPEEAFQLILKLKSKLSNNGKIIVKVPNMSSPWGINYQFGDLTHKTGFNSESLRQLGIACNLQVDKIYDQRVGSRRRVFTSALLHKFLSWALLTPPPFWGANLYCIYSAKLEP